MAWWQANKAGFKRSILPIFGCLFFIYANAQSDTKFWFAAPAINPIHGNTPIYFRLTTYDNPAIITISQPANPLFIPIQRSLNANSPALIDVTSLLAMVENKPGNAILNYGFLITATAPISAYYEAARGNNPEIFPMKGFVSEGTEFLIPGQTRFNNRIFSPIRALSGFVIVATEDNTQVDIALTNKDELGNLNLSIVLNKGQSYAVNAASELVSSHLGGSVINASKPICVTVYDDSIIIGGYDLIGDQIVPIKNTGKDFIVVRGFLSYSSIPNSDFFYVWSTQDNTEISVDGVVVKIINRGQSYEGILSNSSAYITTNKQVYVFQLTGIGGEAAATSLPSITCTGSQKVSFVRSTLEQFYLNLLCKTPDIGSFVINGNTSLINASQFSVVPGTNGLWQYARINVSTNAALDGLISSTNATSVTNSSGLFHLGFLNGSTIGGTRLGYFSNYAQIAIAPAITSSSCYGSDIQLSATALQNVTYAWTGPNNFTSSLANPVILKAQLKDSGMYLVTANINGCGLSRDSIQVTIHPQPTIHFLKSYDTLCKGSAKNINFTLEGKAPWILEYTNDVNLQKDTLKNLLTSPNYFTASPTIKTIYKIINIKDANSCVVTSNITNEQDTVIINQIPIAMVDFATIKCEKNNILFTDKSTAHLDTLTNWYWDFGNGLVQNETSKAAFNRMYDQWGNYTVKLAVKSSYGCNSDTLQKLITIHSLPTIKFGKPEICLKDLYGQFLDSTSSADGSNLVQWKWNFGDVLSNASNPNTSVIKNPVHTYKQAKLYYVSLQATTANNCMNSITDSFKVNGAVPKSEFLILKDTALCSNESVQIKDSSWVDFGTIGELAINWGDGSPDSIVYDPVINKGYQHYYKNIAAPNNLNLQYTIKIKASSGGVCTNESKQVFNFIPPPEPPQITSTKNYLCLSDTLHLNVSSKGGRGPFSYNFNSENASASMTGYIISGLTSIQGPAIISVAVTDSKKCIYPNKNIFSIPLQEIPVATMAAIDTVICNTDAITLIGTGTGALSYTWFRNDTLLNTSLTNFINTQVPGDYKLTVNDGKCNSLKTNPRSITAFNIIRYDFTYQPTICIGSPLTINTSALDQNNVHYKWDFGDGFNYLKANPSAHKYLSKGIYFIKMNVTNDYCPKYNYQIVGKSITVNPPLPSTSYRFYIVANNPTVLKTKQDTGYTNYAWIPLKYLSSGIQANPLFKGDSSQDYSLKRTDPTTQCSVTDLYEVVVSNKVYVTVPTAFTPNNDGLNDQLKVQYSEGVTSDFRWMIYNKWGKLLFMSTDINKGWDGRDANGVVQQSDAYSYFMEYNYIDPVTGTPVNPKKTGSVLILR